MTNEEQKLREIVERWMGKKHPITMQSYVSDLTSLISEHYVAKEDVNQEVEKRIAERMPSEEEIEKHFTTPHYHYEKGHYYKVRKDRIFGANWLRSRLTNPGVNDSQKTEE